MGIRPCKSGASSAKLTGLDSADTAFVGKGIVANEKLLVFPCEDVVCDDAEVNPVSEMAAKSERQSSLA